MSNSILHIGSGKLSCDIIKYNGQDKSFNVFLDRSYVKESNNSIGFIEERFEHWVDHNLSIKLFCMSDIFEFFDAYKFKFNTIIANRIFEHMFYIDGNIGRLLEACNVLTEANGKLEIIVPNHLNLSKKLINLENKLRINDVNLKDIQNQILILNTEFCNIREDPHGSIWSNMLAHYYIESEGIFKIDKIEEEYSHMGRDIYMKIICTKN